MTEPTESERSAPPRGVAPPHPGRRRGLSVSAKAMLITIPAVILVAVLAVVLVNLNRPSTPAPQADASGRVAVVESDSHVLDDAGDGAPTLVEFLDFECEACGAFYPYIEDIREQYDGRINYVVRYYPIPGHFNSMHSAVAVEAAAEQGEFEAMLTMMFETQAEWGERQVSEAARFRGYAEKLGLDMEAYDVAVADPATRTRVEKDFAAGQTLGVSSTPTFFLDGEQLVLDSEDDLPRMLDEALAATE